MLSEKEAGTKFEHKQENVARVWNLFKMNISFRNSLQGIDMKIVTFNIRSANVDLELDLDLTQIFLKTRSLPIFYYQSYSESQFNCKIIFLLGGPQIYFSASSV